MAGKDHDHNHDHDHDHGSELSDTQLRVRALETILTEKGYVDPKALDAIVEERRSVLTEIVADWEEKAERDKARDKLHKFIEEVNKGHREERIVTEAAERLIQLAFLAISLL